MKKNGFIATSLIYSFFLIFVTLFLTIIGDYLQNKVLLNTIENSIKDDINNSLGIQDFEIGDVLFFQGTGNTLNCGSQLCKNNNFFVCDIEYKKSGSSEDKLILKKEENCSGIDYPLTITNKRLKKQENDQGAGFTISGVVS